MPTYEYTCKSCSHAWEQDQKIKDEPLKDCPKCGKPEAKRLISSGTSFQLRGSGWAVDGYGS
jgi:putative FmdB family regulatory protein